MKKQLIIISIFLIISFYNTQAAEYIQAHNKTWDNQVANPDLGGAVFVTSKNILNFTMQKPAGDDSTKCYVYKNATAHGTTDYIYTSTYSGVYCAINGNLTINTAYIFVSTKDFSTNYNQKYTGNLVGLLPVYDNSGRWDMGILDNGANNAFGFITYFFCLEKLIFTVADEQPLINKDSLFIVIDKNSSTNNSVWFNISHVGNFSFMEAFNNSNLLYNGSNNFLNVTGIGNNTQVNFNITGRWNYTLYNNTYFNLTSGQTEQYIAPETFKINISWASPTDNFNHTQYTFVDYNFTVCCDSSKGSDCTVNVSIDPASLTLLNSTKTDENPSRPFFQNNLLYVVSSGGNSFTIYNISNLENIIKLDNLSGDGPPNYLEYSMSVFVSNNLAYVTSYNDDTLSVFNVSNASDIVHVGNISGSGNFLDGAQDVWVVGNTAYVLGFLSDAISTINVTDPYNLVRIASYQNTTYINAPYGIEYYDGIAYISAEDSDALTLINVTNITNLVFLDYIAGAGSPNYLDLTESSFVNNGTVFTVAYTDNSACSFNVSDPSNIVLLDCVIGAGSPNFLSVPRDIVVYDGVSYVTAMTDDSLTVWNVSDPSDLIQIGMVNKSNSTSLDGAYGIAFDIPRKLVIVTSIFYDGFSVWNASQFYTVTEEQLGIFVKGLINTTSGDLPFYTSDNNPQNSLTVADGSCKIINFSVNATGTIGDSYQFFGNISLANNYTMNYGTNVINITIIEEDSCTYQGSGIWTILCSDNCIITQTVDLEGNTILITGEGLTTFTYQPVNFNKMSIHGDSASNICRVRIT